MNIIKNKFVKLLLLLIILSGSFFIIQQFFKKADIKKNLPSSYEELTTEGHKYYLEGKYAEALPYFQKAATIEQSDRIYRSLYSTYLGLGDYANAEIYIKKAATGLNKATPENWIEYAQFEANYLHAPYETVSKIYMDALKATENNIDIITNFASYLTQENKYSEAITYLEKAKTIDPGRRNVFQSDIDFLKSKIQQ